ncbi:uncharacterized protein TRAVEDRAFT_21203 [Trametes versicolor FP-101664 SS1]|uniref:uncharacterized protein n=1 Tax=Trametes versicolor (strain FP-101664) TaxID=717944 RepID=UPI0004624108|nr:uncharacterized protein TRAVEDRAFT_21203 [Trametes versicolor FP-101664 SS1]EIW57653.1 hypothetical protein TRAVEDRAFT_21203 [Trametes versicolor FP-101664 SS1]
MLSDRTLFILLLFSSVLNLVSVISWSRRSSRQGAKSLPRKYSCKGYDYPELLPLPHEPQLISLLMEEMVHYMPLGATSDAELLSLSTPGFDSERLGPDDRTLVVTMFHELHFLRMLNLASTPNITTLPHVTHCLNYLRQSILCSPDLALEPGDIEESDFEVDRTHGVHECKDWAPIYHFVAQNYDMWSDKTGYKASRKDLVEDV